MTLRVSLLLANCELSRQPSKLMRNSRLSKEEALSFLLTHIVAEQGHCFEITQIRLFELMNLAAHAVNQIDTSEEIIAHELIEGLASEFIQQLGRE